MSRPLRRLYSSTPSLAKGLRSTTSANRPPPTHFTQTTPFAQSQIPTTSSSSSSSSTTPSSSSSAANSSSNGTVATTIDVRTPRAGETPRQRAARLREAHRRAQLLTLPWQDRMIEQGRTYLDYAHRGFVIVLMGVAGIGVIGLVWSTISIIRFTRQKSAVYRAETAERRAKVLHDALAAVDQGRATRRQHMFLERYEAVKLAEEERIQKRNLYQRTVDWMFPGVMSAATEATVLSKLDEQLFGGELDGWDERLKGLDEVAPTQQGATGDNPAANAQSEGGNGMLDRVGQNVADATQRVVKVLGAPLRWL